jgi:DNA-binding PadR family transcriptional regulator
MRKCQNSDKLAAKQVRIEEIRLLLCENQLTTQQIEYLTGINTNTLRHYLQEMLSKNYIAIEKLPVKGSRNLNLYRITADGKSLKPLVRDVVVDDQPVVSDLVQWWQINLGVKNEKAAQ